MVGLWALLRNYRVLYTWLEVLSFNGGVLGWLTYSFCRVRVSSRLWIDICDLGIECHLLRVLQGDALLYTHLYICMYIYIYIYVWVMLYTPLHFVC